MPKLNSADTNRVRSINGTYLYYAHEIDPTMSLALNKIPTFQYAPTQDKLKKCNQVLDYALTHPNGTIWYHASDMILMTDTYANYFVLHVSHSCIVGHYYSTNRMPDYSKGIPTSNEPILI